MATVVIADNTSKMCSSCKNFRVGSSGEPCGFTTTKYTPNPSQMKNAIKSLYANGGSVSDPTFNSTSIENAIANYVNDNCYDNQLFNDILNQCVSGSQYRNLYDYIKDGVVGIDNIFTEEESVCTGTGTMDQRDPSHSSNESTSVEAQPQPQVPKNRQERRATKKVVKLPPPSPSPSSSSTQSSHKSTGNNFILRQLKKRSQSHQTTPVVQATDK